MRRIGLIRECHCLLVKIPRTYTTVSAAVEGSSPGVSESYFVLLRAVTSRGVEGVGEMSDLPISAADYLREASYQTGQPIETLQLGQPLTNIDLEPLLGEIESALRGCDPFDVQEVMSSFRKAHHAEIQAGNVYYAKAAMAISMLLYDLVGKALDTPLYNLLGGKIRDLVPVSWVAYIRSVDDLQGEIGQRLAEGFESFKVMAGTNAALDMERVGIVRHMAGPDASIKVDAMASWTVKEAIQRIRNLGVHNLSGVESPVLHADPHGIATVRSAVSEAIIEHVYNSDCGMKLWAANAVDIVNVVPMMTGGIDAARNLLFLATMMSKPAVIGSAVELGPGTAVALHLGVSCPVATMPCDLVGPAMCVDDVITQPFQYSEGALRVRDEPGLGVSLDMRKAALWECPVKGFAGMLAKERRTKNRTEESKA